MKHPSIAYKSALIFLLLAVVFVLPNIMHSEGLVVLRIFLLLTIVIESAGILMQAIRQGGVSGGTKNVLSLLFTFLILFVILETAFMFVGRSHGIGHTLSYQIWHARHWNNTNSDGFRGKNFDPSRREAILVSGDSFTAGHGIDRFEDRYTDVLDKLLSNKNKDVQVVNLGRNAADTKDEYDLTVAFMEKHGIVPRMLVLQYYGNDIEKAAFRNGMAFQGFEPYADLPKALAWVVRGSYLFNFIYWIFPHGDTASYINFLKKAYLTESVLATHFENLRLWIELSRSKNIPLLVVIFPFLQDLAFSKELYVSKLTDFLERENVDNLDVSGIAEKLPVSERVINSNDAHASVKLHELLAGEIANYFEEKFSPR